MKKCLVWALALLAYAQNYYHPTTGVAGTYSGGCQVHTCSGNYYDNGGPGGDYANNVRFIYWTFCPNANNVCLRAQFTSFDVETSPGWIIAGCGPWLNLNCYDILAVINGPAQNGTIIWGGCGTTGPGTVTSTDPSGCLTFRFCSDNSVTRPGWAATLSCVPCTRPAAGNSDCSGAACIAGNISDVSNGPGNSPQCGGCITNENYTNFYIFQPSASGTLTLSVCPSNGTDDYDIAIWGPFTSNSAMLSACNSGALGTPVRCSYAVYPQSPNPPPCGATNACTRLQSGCNDVSENVCGDGCLAPLSVTAGSTYLLMINGWTAGAQGYSLTWGGVPLTCTPLSQPVVAFRAEARPAEGVFLRWSYDSTRLSPEEKLTGWALDRSGDGGQTWQTLVQLPLDITTYLDRQPFVGENLYRLRFGYEDGRTSTYLTTQRVEWTPASGRTFSAWYDPTQESIHIQIFDQGQGGPVHLYTIDGRLLHVLPLEPSPFLSAVGFPITQPGTYIVTYGGHSIAVPVVR